MNIESLSKDVSIEILSITSQKTKKKTVIDHYEPQKKLNDFYFYKIWIMDDIKLQEDGSVKLKSPNSSLQINAVIVKAHETGEFTIRTNEKLTKEIYYLERLFDPTFILISLQASLDIIPIDKQHLCNKIINKLPKNRAIDINDSSSFVQRLNDSQKRAVKLAEEKEVSLIWGPPGTGKTYTLTEIIYRAMKRGESVLVLSTSNVAIDQVLLYLDKVISYSEKKSVRRLGATDNDICNSYIKSNSDVIEESIVFSTLATAALKNVQLAVHEFDFVIVDEASMVSLPYAIFASSMANRNIIFAGDFQQLPPISLSEEKTSLSVNIFDHLNIPQAIASEETDIFYLALLDTQYRMSEKISNLVGSLFYNNKLKCGVEKCESDTDNQLEFIDIDNISNYFNSYYSVEYQSYYNPLTLALFSSILSSHPKAKDVLFITPYRAQQNLISYQIIDSERDDCRSLTVHKSQGSEADLVVFDLTTHTKTNQQGYPKILTSPATKNLINVAISRAKSKVIIIGSMTMIKSLSKNNSLWNKFNQKLQSDFVITHFSDFIKDFSEFQANVNDEKAIVGIFNQNSSKFLPKFANSTADKKIYFSTQDFQPKSGITFKKIKPNDNFPTLVTWGEKVALMENQTYFSLQSSMVSKVLPRIAIGHLVDIEEASGSDAISLLCENCGNNKNLVHHHNNGPYYLKCQQCNQEKILSLQVANDLKSIYQIKCPQCMADVKPRKKTGQHFYSFYGCSNFPNCKGLVSLNQYSSLN
jgi:superfamily I DNA and/or RNA helicase